MHVCQSVGKMWRGTVGDDEEEEEEDGCGGDDDLG